MRLGVGSSWISRKEYTYNLLKKEGATTPFLHITLHSAKNRDSRQKLTTHLGLGRTLLITLMLLRNILPDTILPPSLHEKNPYTKY